MEKSMRNLPKTSEPCIMVIFGATGDLTARKLMPALYNLNRENLLPQEFACVGFARREKSNEVFREEMLQGLKEFSRSKPEEDDTWSAFSERLFYHQSPFDQDEGYEALKKMLSDLDAKFGTKGNRIFYLSTQPSYFPVIVEKLKSHKLIYDKNSSGPWSRVIIEKPFGHNLESAIGLQKHITQFLTEDQVYRIDHYLGKETVQNLLVFRFANSIYESLWNNRYIDNIQITVSEELGIGTRGKFFEEAGILRDIVQNHMMQLLSLVAMEPPVSLKATAIRDEKVKVLNAIRPIDLAQFEKQVVRGQYAAGRIEGQTVAGYREEKDVAPTSEVETYVAMKLHIDNWRWFGVPFYLRAGKRLAKRCTEIVVNFKPIPNILFQQASHNNDNNVLAIRIQPNEGIALRINCKVPGTAMPIQPVKMDFRYDAFTGVQPPEAYERLICDAIWGDNTLFIRWDEVLASWTLLTPVLDRWQKDPKPPLDSYTAGSWGPESAANMLMDEGTAWRSI
ncbi:MAG: glucose-6-phosphate dehydrogenase [Parachlamydiales bacterium]|nr:glucose-6-phosphate dehydrogenase [Parachlamydiales bacterium]